MKRDFLFFFLSARGQKKERTTWVESRTGWQKEKLWVATKSKKKRGEIWVRLTMGTTGTLVTADRIEGCRKMKKNWRRIGCFADCQKREGWKAVVFGKTPWIVGWAQKVVEFAIVVEKKYSCLCYSINLIDWCLCYWIQKQVANVLSWCCEDERCRVPIEIGIALAK